MRFQQIVETKQRIRALEGQLRGAKVRRRNRASSVEALKKKLADPKAIIQGVERELSMFEHQLREVKKEVEGYEKEIAELAQKALRAPW